MEDTKESELLTAPWYMAAQNYGPWSRERYEGNRRCSHKGCPVRKRRDPGGPWECPDHDAALWEDPEMATLYAVEHEDRADADRAALQTHGETLTAAAVERLARHWRTAA